MLSLRRARFMLFLSVPAGSLLLFSAQLVQAQDKTGVTASPAAQKASLRTDSQRGTTTPVPQPANLVQKDQQLAIEDAMKKSAEIAALQKQIQEKRKKIELLLRLFTTDERSFMQSPTEPNADPTIQDRQRREQEELRRESVECAGLQARLDALQSSIQR